ncbi:hypothetical protein MIND_01177700 [Mycena indigotica]|uniref:Cytochrome P450 n=1 Tax=Mycena indigotica TaxID=2126181 RepID=A0A8H6S424_9AGAR|nr:uncharacterized protein MIND_01177700 [Mycena indigotica]KAF7292790.1 hypothetical protein MIND_01177700 [Mycena indigotica]
MLITLKLRKNHPPVINIFHLQTTEIFLNPRQAYEEAIRDIGPVIAVLRKGHLEFVVDDTLVSFLVSNSTGTFDFEAATATILHLRPFLFLFRSFFSEIDDLVQNGINPMLDNILERSMQSNFADRELDAKCLTSSVCVVFSKSAEKALGKTRLDMFDHAHRSIAEAMLGVIFGEGYATERNIMAVENVATDISNLTGIYQNTSFFGRHLPTLWSVYTWIKVLSTSILAFFRIMGPLVWRYMKQYSRATDTKPTTVLEFLCQKYGKVGSANHSLGVFDFLQIMSLLIGYTAARQA